LNWLAPIASFRSTREVHTQMPLAHHRGVVTLVAKHRRKCHPSISNQAISFCLHHTRLFRRPPTIPSRQKTIPRRCANRIARMAIGKRDSLSCQPIQIGCRKFCTRIQATCIAEPLIISVNDDDIWIFRIQTFSQ